MFSKFQLAIVLQYYEPLFNEIENILSMLKGIPGVEKQVFN